MGIAQSARGLVITHTVQQGVALHSFGITMAQQAGLPRQLVMRAEQLLETAAGVGAKDQEPLDREAVAYTVVQSSGKSGSKDWCMIREHQSYNELALLLRTVRIDDISPRQALDLLVRLQERVSQIERNG